MSWNLSGVLFGTLSIFAFNLILAAAFVGLGLALRRTFGIRRADLGDIFIAFWMGFGLVIFLLMVWNFFFPVGPVALPAVLVSGIAFLIKMRTAAAEAVRELRSNRLPLLGMVLFCLWVANISIGPMMAWDSLLYHMQGVQWARHHPVVPGLANLFGPLGFNNASFLYNAMLDTGPWQGRAWHVSNGLLVSMVGMQAIAGAIRPSGINGRRSIAPLLLLPLAVNSMMNGWVSSFMTVLPASLVTMVVVVRGHLALSDPTRGDSERAYDFFCIAALSAIAVSLKLSIAVFAATMTVVSFYGALRLVAAGRSRTLATRWSVVAVAVIGLAWTGRGIILSGYPLFPSRALGVPVEWRVPAEHARAEFDFIVHSSRASADNVQYLSGNVTGVTVWLLQWVRDAAFFDLYDIVIPSVVAGLLAGFFLARRRRAVQDEQVVSLRAWAMFIPVALSLGVWASTSPMPHYAAPFFWSLPLLLASQIDRARASSPFSQRITFAAACLLGFSPCLVNPIWAWLRASNHAEGVVVAVAQANVQIPSSDRWFSLGEPPPPVTQFTTRSGLVLNVPVDSAGRTWDTPLPTTPTPDPNLKLRIPMKIESGFIVDGEWQMQNWPEPWRPQLLPAMREGWRKLDRTSPVR